MKNKVNKQLVKALSVGIAASMALQPVAVYAEDGVNQNEEKKSEFDTAADKASGSVEAAHDSFVGAEPQTEGTQDAATTESSVAVVGDSAEVQNPIQDAKTETEGYKEVLKNEVTNGSEVFADEIGKLNTAEDKLDEGASALNGADQAVKDAQTSNKVTEEKTADYLDHMDKAEDILEHGKPVEGEDHVHKVDQFTDASTGAGEASASYDGIITDAGKVATDMNEVKNSADNYDAAGDTTGAQFDAIKKEYDAAKAVLDGLDQRLADATADYDEANDNYEDAVDALGKAQDEYDLALAAYNAIIDTLDEDGKVTKEGSVTTTNKKIELAKENLAKAQKALDEAELTVQDLEKVAKSAEDEVNDAKTNLEAAKASVQTKLNNMQNLKLQEILDLQAEIEEITDETQKEAKNFELHKKFIEYYLLGADDISDVQFSSDKAAFVIEPAKDLNGDTIVDDDGNYYYVTGYVNGTPQLAIIPTAYTVTYKKAGVEEPITVYFSVDPDNDGSFTIFTENGTPIQQTTILEEAVAEKYLNADGNEVDKAATIGAVADNQKHTKDNNNVLVIDMSDKIADITDGTSESLTTYSDRVLSEGGLQYVEGSANVQITDGENGTKIKTITKTYVQTVNTESLTKDENQPDADYEYGTHEVVTETVNKTYPFSKEGYAQWKADIQKYSNEDDFKAEFYDVDLIWWGPFLVDVKTGMKDVNNMTDIDNISLLFDIAANYLFGAKPFTISYTASETTVEKENKEGFLETVNENYTKTNKTVEKTYTQTSIITITPVPNEKVDSGEATASGTSNVWGHSEHSSEKKKKQSDAQKALEDKVKELNGSNGYVSKTNETVLSSETNGNVTVTTYTWTEQLYEITQDAQKTKDNKYRGKYRLVEKTYTRTDTKTTTFTYEESDPTVVDPNYTYVGEEVKNQSSQAQNIVKSKTFYGADEYTFVAGHEQKTGAYYNVADAQEWGTSSDSDYQAALNEQAGAKQALLDAQEAYSRASISYQNAQTALNQAKADVNALKASDPTKRELVDAQHRLSEAETALSTATTNKETAETALGEALQKKQEAEEAVAAAKSAWKLTKPSYDKAEADKKAADDARNATGDDDFTPSNESGDDTSSSDFVFVAAPGAVVTPAVANDGEAVLGEVRRTATRSSKKAASTSEAVSTDNGNSNNSEVAGAKKEETKTPEAPKTETKIEDGETALAATPELQEKGFAWWWLLILAAIAGVSVEEYARRKSNKAKAENSTKVNK
ncbi:hypothetical protein D6855_01395 [Butyrivibrio sp. CB08]|uniref:hypothetical protein n=1 Tax=Butyrivibrio sp. CB08 TaxID=2364879 RepID=UPI000EA98081|nr:hypothetical protein [Butyrivibrio sp. CB08]RKM62105.1 hypothetical protein D6855_01395 [Butyrivibrio sp. CB08]